MGFGSSGSSGQLAITTIYSPYANTYTTLSGTYGADMLMLSENTNDNNIYTSLASG
jgi:hypothetical protein